MQELEAKKLADWTAKKNRIEEASRKKSELDKEFSNQARDNLTAKMDNYGENREAIMAEMKDKLKVCEISTSIDKKRSLRQERANGPCLISIFL